MNRIRLLLVLCSLSAAASAQVLPEQDLYQIEVLVFSRYGSPSGTPPAPASDRALSLFDGSGEHGPFAALAPTELQLGGAAARLRGAGYVVLAHAGWRQPAVGRERAVPVRIAGPGTAGTIAFTLGRYPHGAVDLHFGGTAGGSGAYGFRDGAGRAADILKQARRIELGVLQYFDDPRYGALMMARLIRRAQARDAEEREPESQDLLDLPTLPDVPDSD